MALFDDGWIKRNSELVLVQGQGWLGREMRGSHGLHLYSSSDDCTHWPSNTNKDKFQSLHFNSLRVPGTQSLALEPANSFNTVKSKYFILCWYLICHLHIEAWYVKFYGRLLTECHHTVYNTAESPSQLDVTVLVRPMTLHTLHWYNVMMEHVHCSCTSEKGAQ